MGECWSCSKELPPDGDFCPSCGSRVNASTTDLTATIDSAHVVATVGAADSDEERLLPGTVVGGRYRLFGLLGRGGMGVVYRADDLKLGQPVALKYLPKRLCTKGMLDRFYNEVRVARRVSHPNVCRIYDIFESEGRHFLSMEYIDGEDLASLLRRIGRLPTDKAVEIARQLCAGVAAAHDQGVLHRDLKPANVMIDGRGQVRITDFGLAGLAKEITGKEIRAGTPAYMSPEQSSGKEVSVRSDIYALGLSLYEVFTGRRAFEAERVAEVRRLHESQPPTRPSEFVDDLDPSIERVILGCLEKDPDLRPQTALGISAALPGGDRLAAALAAGETPSPEMVASADAGGGVDPLVGVGCVLFVMVGLGCATFLAPKMSLFQLAVPEKPPVVLADRARGLLASLGYEDEPVDRAYWMGRDMRYVHYVQKRDSSPGRWAALSRGQPAVVVFMYRESPVALSPVNSAGRVWPFDPPPLSPGMVNVTLDGRGRLAQLRVIPPRAEREDACDRETDYGAVFAAAGLDLAFFETAAATISPPVYCDSVRAWRGVYPDHPELPLRVQAGVCSGRCVYFEMLGPWDSGEESSRDSTTGWPRFSSSLVFALQMVVLVGGGLLARRHHRLGRGDGRGAIRLGLFSAGTYFVGWVFTAHHASRPAAEWALIQSMLGTCLWVGVFGWILYIAIEPFVRRRRPQTMITWTRLLGGRFRDRLVGRDILVGAALGVLLTLVEQVHYFVPGWLGMAPPRPTVQLFGAFGSFGSTMNHVFQQLPDVIYTPMIILLLILLLEVLVGRQWLAVGGMLGLLTGLAPLAIDSGSVAVDAVVRGVTGIVILATLYRFGLLSVVFLMFFRMLIFSFPLTYDVFAWYAGPGIVVMLIVVGACVYGFVIASAGRLALDRGVLRE